MIADHKLPVRRPELPPAEDVPLGIPLRGGPKNVAQTPAIPRCPQGVPASPSLAQRRLWFAHQLVPESPLYNLAIGLRTDGQIDRPALGKSLAAIVARHESLRARFVGVDGEPVQVVDEPRDMPLRVVDLTAGSVGERDTEIKRLWKEEASRPFNLSNGLLLRVVLARLGANDQLLLVTHRIAADAWSVEVLLGELFSLYETFARSQTARFPDLSVPCTDIAVWQNERHQGEAMAEHLGYWRQQLAGAPALLEFPTDRSRPAIQSFRGARQPVVLSRSLKETLEALSRQENVSLFMTLLGAFQTLAMRYTGRDDIVIGSPVAGRHRAEIKGLIGPFSNTLVLRTDLSGNPTFRTLLSRVRRMVLQAYAHQELPFERLVEELRSNGDWSYHPLFQVRFSFQNEPMRAPRAGGLNWTRFDIDSGTAECDLTLHLTRTRSGMEGWIEYAADLFEAATIQRMAEHWKTLLEGVAANPDCRLSELPLLGPAERHRLLVEWNDTASDYPREATIARLFESQASRTPDALALVCEEASLTYRELNARANQLAVHLRSLKVGPEIPVGICLVRSWPMVVGILAILKAGGAYVPLDPAYPRDRLRFILADAQPPVLLTQQNLLSFFSDCAPAAVVCLDSDWGKMRNASEENPAPGVHAENLAYVMYTSGSTGRPKGVAIEHRSVAALLHWARQVFDPEELSGVLASTSVCFDLSVFELFVPLSCGGKVILAENALQLPALNAADQVTLVNTVPSAMKELLRLNGIPRSVRVANLAGEPLPASLVTRVYQETGVQKVYDLYGPTETTVYSTFALRKAGEPATIGQPLADESVYLLDAHRQPVPVGVPGEIYIGGAGLARGYLNRPDLTAEKFIHESFHSNAPPERLYRTGDLARYRPDGNIEFLGRMDNQVKIRGFRIELGEVETALREHPTLHGAEVLAREDQPGDKRLVAYFVLKPGQSTTREELRVFLKEKVPAYMAPSVFVPLDELPLAPNGKVDRRALPAPDLNGQELENRFVAPRDGTELRLAKIWEEVLHAWPVGVRHHFFELGGDSLLAARLVARIEENFARKLSIGAVFRSPTVEQLAKLLRNGSESGLGSASSIVEIQSHGAKPPLFLVHGMGGGMFWGYTNLSRHLGGGQPIYAFNSRGLAGLEEFSTIEEMAAQYLADLRAFQPNGPYCLGGYCFGGNVAYEMARLLAAQGEKTALLALFNCPAHNSGYDRFRVTPATCFKFLQNLRRWAGHVLELKREQARDFLRWKARAMQKKCVRLFNRLHAAPSVFNVDEWVDLSSQPEDRHKLWAAHMRAYLEHRPKPYSGHVTLFRTHDHALFCSFDDAYGWRELAAGGVTVRVFSGAHESILDEPHVQAVADALKSCLGDIRDQIPG